MVLYRKSKSLVFLMWAISVFLLCAGSLINFHQNKIWGKPLNFELVAVKREAKPVVKVCQDDSSGGNAVTASILTDLMSLPQPEAGYKISFNRIVDDNPVLRFSGPSALRAPPAVS